MVRLELKTEIGAPYLPVATGFVEKAAHAFGFGDAEALALTLATEEVFAHLYRVALPQGGTIELACTDGGYYLRVDFSIPLARLDLRAFNLTTAVSPDDEAALEELGLVLASRTVDRFWVSQNPGGGHTLSFAKGRRYPKAEGSPPPTPRPLGPLSVRRPTPEELKLFGRLAWLSAQAPLLPEFLGCPGKLVDMVASGEYEAAVAVDRQGAVGGGILWTPLGDRMVECFGPYRVDGGREADVAEALLDACIGAVARSRALGLLNRFPGPDLPGHHFERLGALAIRREDGSVTEVPTRFRLLGEDLGCVVWCHARLEEFVRQEYSRLVLPRQITPTGHEGEARPPHSVLSAECERPHGFVTLRPIARGADFAQTLASHVALFAREGLPNVFFELDLGQAWQSDFVPALLDQGFQPKLLLPYAGRGDLVCFQLLPPCP